MTLDKTFIFMLPIHQESLLLLKPVVKDFVKAFGKYITTQFTDCLQKFARGKA